MAGPVDLFHVPGYAIDHTLSNFTQSTSQCSIPFGLSIIAAPYLDVGGTVSGAILITTSILDTSVSSGLNARPLGYLPAETIEVGRCVPITRLIGN
jgi:hypothetical protein